MPSQQQISDKLGKETQRLQARISELEAEIAVLKSKKRSYKKRSDTVESSK